MKKLNVMAGTARKKAYGLGKSLAAGAAGAGVVVGSAVRGLKKRAENLSVPASKKKKGEITVKKSTLVALIVALATVAGVLGALYFYVLRREKELDEYEQLLFSEDFDDDFGDVDEVEALG